MGFAMGPDEFGSGLKFESSGKPQDEVEVQLRVVDGRVTVKTISTSGGGQMWDSFKKIVYYVSGTFNNWSYTAMAPDVLVPGLFKHHVLVGQDGSGNRLCGSRQGRPQQGDNKWPSEACPLLSCLI